MKIGVFGGSFNPPHMGHVQSVRAAVSQLHLDLLLVVPAAIPPHKKLPEKSPDAGTRYLMTSLAFEEESNVTVSDIELKQNAICYSIETVMKIKDSYPAAAFYLLLGTDMFLSLESWKNSEELMKVITPAVFYRSEELRDHVVSHSARLYRDYGVASEIVETEVIDISSSTIRELLPVRQGNDYLPEQVYSLIVRNRLYGVKVNWEWLRGVSHSMLNQSRIAHVAGCEDEAVKLASFWDVDVDAAREAAILHDITKKLTYDENLVILKKYNQVSDNMLDIVYEKLLHAKTGALLARHEFGSSDEVYEAIRWHTTGKAGMTELEKIIYLADYIEPNRDLDGIDQLRKLSYSDLNKAVKLGLEMAVADLLARRKTPCRETLEAIEDLA